MYQKILIALDMSQMAETVFNHGLSLAKQETNSRLLLLHILSTEEDNSPLPIPSDLTEMYPAAGNDLTLETWKEQWEAFEASGVKMLESYQNKATETDITTEIQQIYGNPGSRICKVAKEWHADPEFLTKSAIAKHRSLTGSGFEQSDRRFPQPTVCCQILS